MEKKNEADWTTDSIIVRIRTAKRSPIAIGFPAYLSLKAYSVWILGKLKSSVIRSLQKTLHSSKYENGEMTALMPTERKRLLKNQRMCGVIAQYYLDTRPGRR